MSALKKLAQLENDAASFGFAWEKPEQILAQIQSECVEIHAHLNKKDERDKLQEEIGDLLHAAFSLCVFCDFDPEVTLQNSIDKFETRFEAVKVLVAKDGLSSLNGFSFDKLMAFWDAAKKITDKNDS